MNQNVNLSIEERLALHLGLTTMLIQNGAPLSMVQQQVLGLRGVINTLLADQRPGETPIRITQLFPESVAEQLAKDVVIPDDLEDLE